MNNFDTFDEYREAAVPYQSNQRYIQSQAFQGGDIPPREAQVHRQRPYPKLQPRSQRQKQAVPVRMPKAQALVLLQKVKRGVVIASFFCSLLPTFMQALKRCGTSLRNGSRH